MTDSSALFSAAQKSAEDFLASSAPRIVDDFSRKYLSSFPRRIIVFSSGSYPASVLAQHLVEELRVRFIAGKVRGRADRPAIAVLEIDTLGENRIPPIPFSSGDVAIGFSEPNEICSNVLKQAEASGVPALIFTSSPNSLGNCSTVSLPQSEWSLLNCVLLEVAVHALCEFCEDERPVPPVASSFKEHIGLLERLTCDKTFTGTVDTARQHVTLLRSESCPLFLIGNGGSACDAQLLAYFGREFSSKSSQAVHIEAAVKGPQITCALNDGLKVFARTIEPFSSTGSPAALIGFSTSGNSQNIIEAFELLKDQLGERYALGILGNDGGRVASELPWVRTVVVPHKLTHRIQEVHLLVGAGILSV